MRRGWENSRACTTGPPNDASDPSEWARVALPGAGGGRRFGGGLDGRRGRPDGDGDRRGPRHGPAPDSGPEAHVWVIQGDLTTMFFPEASFDVIHSRSVLMHIDADRRRRHRTDPRSPPRWRRPLRRGRRRPGGQRRRSPCSLSGRHGPAGQPLDMGPPPARPPAPPGPGGHRRRRPGRPPHRRDPGRCLLAAHLALHPPLLTDPGQGPRPARRPWTGQVDAMLALLDDPALVMPFALRHNVSGRRPGAQPTP